MSNANATTEKTEAAIEIYKPKNVMSDIGAKIINAYVGTYDRELEIEALAEKNAKDKRMSVNMATVAIGQMCADKRVADLVAKLSGDAKTDVVEQALNTIRLGLGFGNVVIRANGHKGFEYAGDARKAFVTDAAKDSPEAKRADTLRKNFGQMLKEASRAYLGTVVMKAKIETDTDGFLKITGGQTKKIFGADEVTIKSGGNVQPIKEGKAKPTISALANVGSGKSRSKPTTTPNQGKQGETPISDVNQLIQGCANALIEAINRAKGLAEINADTVKSLSRVRELINEKTSTLVKAPEVKAPPVTKPSK